MQGELTSFVGRTEELRHLRELITERRFVTLTGVGGGGKTRLAAELCRQAEELWSDGVWWVDLGSVSDPGLVVRTVANSLGVLVEAGDDAVVDLVGQLRGSARLVCLDTCEHLLDATSSLADRVLRGCPDVVLVATSREPLGVPGETIYHVPALKADEAVRLFNDRATYSRPGFEPENSEHDVRAVCARVDGVPLAIELAAAWVRTLTPAQIASGLDDSFRLLAGGPRRATPRHRALAASMDWSHALLDEVEQGVLRRLAVFAGSFDLEAARAVCVDDADAESDALGVLRRLVEKSLVVTRWDAAQSRYQLLDTVRQYAEEKLQAAGETELVRDRHLDHILRVAERAVPGLERDQDAWTQALVLEHDNIHGALQWGLRTAADRADRGRRLAAAMYRQWFVQGQTQEGLAFLDRAIELEPNSRSDTQAQLLCGRAMLGMLAGRFEVIGASADLAQEIAADTDDARTYARALDMVAYPLFFTDAARCQELAWEAGALGEACGDAFAQDWATALGAFSLIRRDRHAEGMALAGPAYRRSLSRGDRFCAGFNRGAESFGLLYTGEVRRAVTVGRDVLDVLQPLNDYFAYGTNASNVALALGMSGDIDGGRQIMAPVTRGVTESRDVDVVGYMYTNGVLGLWSGELEEAVLWFERGIRLLGTYEWTAVRCQPLLAGALRRLGRTEEATDMAAQAVAAATRVEGWYALAEAWDEQARLIAPVDAARAFDLHHEALALRRRHCLRTFYVDSLDAIATITATTGDPKRALRLLGASTAGREAMGYPRPYVDSVPHATLVESLRCTVGDNAFARAWAEGTGQTLQAAVAVATRGRGPHNRPAAGWSSLTPTELDVTRLVVDGLTNPEIGRQLFISRGTVKTHLSHVYTKLGTSSRTELVALAAARLPQSDGADSRK